ncbi:MAG: nucleotide pyrophosphatase [bacterium]|nr:nucleotide pyrophosphatase [bacterium]
MKLNRVTLLLAVIFSIAMPMVAYVGPGAGFAFAGSFLFIFVAFFLAIFNFLTFPIRALIKFFKRLQTMKYAKYKRVVIVGFDGMDYTLMKKFIAEGRPLPNFEKLAKDGTFAPLLSTEPPISPVAWSTFSTGVNPGKHNIFDFLATDRRTYMPKMAGSDIIPPKRVLNIGKYTIPISKPKIEWKRKSQSFWKIIGSKGIFSTVLRVPFTFPPERFSGVILAGLGTPDLRGTQGSFSFYSDSGKGDYDISDGVFETLEKVSENNYKGFIKGPVNPFLRSHPVMKIPFTLEVNRETKSAKMTIGKETYTFKLGVMSQWIPLKFKAGLVKIAGLVQGVLEDVTEGKPLRLYLSPINIDPEDPSMPVSHPKIFSVYLAKLMGSFSTLGMGEDTWALNERVLSEEAFIQQVYQLQDEKEKIFFDTFKKYKSGLLIQIFESTDRMQHMFWRYLKDSGSPADKLSDNPEVTDAIYKMYLRMDEFMGRLTPQIKKDDLLMVVSDHGFNSFNREFHLNTWLHKEGYLVLKDGKTTSGKWYADVDWSKSRAYGQGLNGLYLNLKGREKHGIVKPGKEEEALKEEIKQKLLKVVDEEKGEKAIKLAFKREERYRGPYTRNAPDIVIGYTVGYRVSWESAVNYVGENVFTDNLRLWSGDHAFTREDVPGILFSNQDIQQKDPSLADISPTILKAFGIKPPSFIDGRDLVA